MKSDETKKHKILIVEDDRASQELFKLLFGKNYDLSFCNDENGFFAFVESTKANIVIMDISLNGEKNGLELIQYVRENNPVYKHTPIICYSAHAFSQDKTNALNAGADIFIKKPAANEILLEAVESIIKNVRELT